MIKPEGFEKQPLEVRETYEVLENTVYQVKK
jgi:hypothetical protein